MKEGAFLQGEIRLPPGMEKALHLPVVEGLREEIELLVDRRGGLSQRDPLDLSLLKKDSLFIKGLSEKGGKDLL